MHPIERLRYVARATGDGPSLLVREAAGALASFSSDPAALVTACRRLVDRQPHAAPIWWLAARVLAAAEPAREAWKATDEIEDDPTPVRLAESLPEDAQVLVLGWPEQVSVALARRADLRVFIVDAAGQGAGLARRLDRMGGDAILVEERGLGAAAAEVDLVLLEADGFGPSGAVCVSGSRAAAAVARHAERPVWVAVGAGRALPGRLFEAYLRRLIDAGDPWDLDCEAVPLDLLDHVVGPTGLMTPQAAIAQGHCPVVPELLKELS